MPTTTNIYATLTDLSVLWRPVTTSETDKAEELLEAVSAEIRAKAKKQGKDFDAMVSADADLAQITKAIVCKVVGETMNKDADMPAMSQFSESAGGYSFSGTYYSASIGTFLSRNDWKRLGLGSAKYGGLDIYA